MAVSKLWSVTARLGQVIDYATNPDKTTKSKSKYSEADYQALKDVLAYGAGYHEAVRYAFGASKRKRTFEKYGTPTRREIRKGSGAYKDG